MVNKMMNVLLTGADGQLGSDFKKLFEEKGISYTATDYNNLDITDTVQMESFFSKNNKFTHIINCAAYNDVDKAETDENVFLVNTEAPAILAEFAKKINADYVTYSTDFVFDGKKSSPYSEEDTASPLSKYGKTKKRRRKSSLKTFFKVFCNKNFMVIWRRKR